MRVNCVLKLVPLILGACTQPPVPLAGIADTELGLSAAWYLMSTEAAEHLSPAQVRDQVDSRDAERALIGQALIKLRGGTPDLERARDLLSGMAAEQRDRCFFVRIVLELQGEDRR